MGGALSLYISLVRQAPLWLQEKIIAEVKNNCADCSLSIGKTVLSALPPRIEFEEVKFETGSRKLTHFSVDAHYVRATVSVLPLLRKKVRIRDVHIARPRVLIVNGPGREPPAKAKANEPDESDWELLNIEIVDGFFQFQKLVGRKGALLRIHGIQAEVDRFGNSARSRTEPWKGVARGLLENSGKFVLSVAARPLDEIPIADVDLDIHNQVLSELNPYFATAEGVRLNGVLLDAVGQAALRGKTLKATVNAKYRGLDIDVQPDPTRNALVAAIATFIASIQLDQENYDSPPELRVKSAEIRQKKNESVIAFVLRGLKDAALKVTTE